MSIRVPGAFWVALIVFCLTWLPQIVTADWVNPVLLALYALLKAVEVLTGLVKPELPRSGASPTRTAFYRALFG